MANRVKLLKEIYLKGNKTEDDNNFIKNKPRSASTFIKDRVQFYQNIVDENENRRKRLFEISKKFGLHKYLKSKKNDNKNNENIYGCEEILENNAESEDNNSDQENYPKFNQEDFIGEIQEMCENYEKEIENMKMKLIEVNEVKNKEKIIPSCQCESYEKLLKETEFIKFQLIQKEEEIVSMKKQNEEIHKKYEDYNTYMDSMIINITNDDKFKTNEYGEIIDTEFIENDKNYISKNIKLKSKNNYTDNFIIEIISENIFKEYKQNISINIETLNKKILGKKSDLINSGNKNFLTFLTTCFMNDNMGNLSLSIYHEYLQDIITQIYISFRKIKANKLMLNDDDYSWIISEEDIDQEVIQNVVEEIFKNNTNYKNSLNNLDDFFDDIFSKNYSKFTNHLKITIKQNFLNKIENFNKKVKNDITNIVTLTSQYIHAGKLFYKSNLIYDYWKLYNDIISFIQGNKFYLTENSHNAMSRVNYYQTLQAPDYSGYLISKLRFNNMNYETIYLTGTMNEEDIQFFQLKIIISHIITNSELRNKLQAMTITEMNLNEDCLTFINRLIEFCPNLSTLDISNNKLSDKGIRMITESIKNNISIKTLHLSNNEISSNGCFYLAEMLLKNQTISNLFLGGNSMRDLGLLSLINILINNNRSIKLLDLSNNNLNNSDMIIISNLIMKNLENLETLNISNHKFDLDIINSLGLVLKVNTKLKCLYLNNIDLDEETTPYFMHHLLEVNLEEIYLDENNLGEIGGVLFANVIKFNHKLKKVSLKRTNINSISLMCISHAMEVEMGKSSMEVLFMDDNKFDESSIDSLINTINLYCKKFKRKNFECEGNLNVGKFQVPKLYLSAECLEKNSIRKIVECESDSFIVL